jgi:hypothetical protein
LRTCSRCVRNQNIEVSVPPNLNQPDHQHQQHRQQQRQLHDGLSSRPRTATPASLPDFVACIHSGTLSRTCSKPIPTPIRPTKAPQNRAFRSNARIFFGFTKGDASPRACVHICRHGSRRTGSLHFLRAVHNLLLSCYLQPGRGDASLRPLRWGLDESGILQSRAENRCNPRASPPRAARYLCKTTRKPRLFRAGRLRHSDVFTWPLRCSPIAVLVSSKRQRSAFLTAKCPSALPALASARTNRIGILLELSQ